MPDDADNPEKPAEVPPEDEKATGGERSSRRRSLTPDERRLLGTPRAKDEVAEPEPEPPPKPEPRPEAKPEPRPEPRRKLRLGAASPPEPHRREREHRRSHRSTPADAPTPDATTSDPTTETADRPRHGDRTGRPSEPLLQRDVGLYRGFDFGRAVLVLGGILALVLAFYVGRQFDHWRSALMAGRQEPKIEQVKDRFGNRSADELVREALVAQRAGRVPEAIELFLGAKRRNLHYRGIIFRVGRLAADAGRFDDADKFFERAISFDEDVDAANFQRGLIAVRRKDFSAAQRYFRAATEAGPFVPDYPYYLGEAFRMDHRPHEAIPSYEHAALLSRNNEDHAVAEFKVRMAQLEAGDAPAVAAQIEAQQQRAPLTVEWLMTAAAWHLREARVPQARALIDQARAANQPRVFVSCAADLVFTTAAEEHGELAESLHVERSP